MYDIQVGTNVFLFSLVFQDNVWNLNEGMDLVQRSFRLISTEIYLKVELNILLSSKTYLTWFWKPKHTLTPTFSHFWLKTCEMTLNTTILIVDICLSHKFAALLSAYC